MLAARRASWVASLQTVTQSRKPEAFAALDTGASPRKSASPAYAIQREMPLAPIKKRTGEKPVRLIGDQWKLEL